MSALPVVEPDPDGPAAGEAGEGGLDEARLVGAAARWPSVLVVGRMERAAALTNCPMLTGS